MSMWGEFVENRFGPGRSAVFARRGMVSTSHPLASLAGLDALREGGTAVDAAVTAAAVLGVVEPMSSGLGGDLFALVWSAAQKRLYGLNASGRSGRQASREALRARGVERIPSRGPLTVTVPGQVDGFAELLRRFGRFGFDRALRPAIECAAEGFPVSPIVSRMWEGDLPLLQRSAHTASHYLIDGRAPRPGEIFRQTALAESLRLIAAHGPDALYRGPIAAEIVRHLEAAGGLLDAADFAEHTSDWVEPIHTVYRDHEIYEMPPNSQGLTALIALNLLEASDMRGLGHNSSAALHRIAEALKIAFADRNQWVADPEHERLPVAALLSAEYTRNRAQAIQEETALAMPVPPGRPGTDFTPSDTVYLCAADQEGNLVSLITSIAASFGSGEVGGATGIVLQNRGSGFRMDPGHPNCLAPRKRSLHTIIPGMVGRDGRPSLAFGVMGGDMQPQGHVQFLVNLLDHGMNVQDALDAPRLRVQADGSLCLEPGIPDRTGVELAWRGHRLQSPAGVFFGSGQAIAVDPASSVMIGGADHRRDGCALGY